MRIIVSLHSEPELVKKAWSSPFGVTVASFPASSVAAGWVHWKKVL